MPVSQVSQELGGGDKTVKVVTLSKTQFDEFPQGAVWNAFVDLLCLSTESELSPEQLSAFHAFWYDAEVQNGGHLQYFLNRGVEEAGRAVLSLRSLGAHEHADLLDTALTLRSTDTRRPPRTVWGCVKRAREGKFDEFDRTYHEIHPSMFEVLENHLRQNQQLFVVLGP